MTTYVNLATRAWQGKLTVQEVNATTKEILEDDIYYDCTVLYNAIGKCSIEVVEAILDKGVNVNGFDGVSSVACCYLILIGTKLTLFKCWN
jgi:hypothetical protein